VERRRRCRSGRKVEGGAETAAEGDIRERERGLAEVAGAAAEGEIGEDAAREARTREGERKLAPWISGEEAC
jgi:hypothetical protein